MGAGGSPQESGVSPLVTFEILDAESDIKSRGEKLLCFCLEVTYPDLFLCTL